MFAHLSRIPPSDPGAVAEVAKIIKAAAGAWSDVSATIGEDFMVVKHSMHSRSSIIDYEGVMPPVGKLMGEPLNGLVLRFTPWIIGNQTIVSPMEMTSSFNFNLAGWPVTVFPTASSDGGMYFGPQGREMPPA
jgi:hypothetical protein